MRRGRVINVQPTRVEPLEAQIKPYQQSTLIPGGIPVIACTGHRDLGKFEARVEADLSHVWHYPYPRIIVTGGAMGLDTLAAEVAQRGRESTRIVSVVARPYPGHQTKFPYEWRLRWDRTWAAADVQVTVCAAYSVQAYHIRNRYMLELARTAVIRVGPGNGFVLAFWDGRRAGGTFATLQEARRMRLGVQNTHPELMLGGGLEARIDGAA